MIPQARELLGVNMILIPVSSSAPSPSHKEVTQFTQSAVTLLTRIMRVSPGPAAILSLGKESQ